MLELWHIILIAAVGGTILVVLLIVGCMCIICCHKLSKRKSSISAKQEKLHERADKSEKEAIKMANKLPKNPDKRKVKESLISHQKQQASKFRDQAAKLPDDNAKRCKKLRDQADKKEQKKKSLLDNLEPQTGDKTKRKEQLKMIKKLGEEIERLRKAADRMTIDSGEEKDGGNGEEGNVQDDTSDGGDAICRSTTNPNSTGQKEHEVVDSENAESDVRED